MSSFAGFIVGLALGLSVAVAVYLYDRRPQARVAEQRQPVVSDEAPRESTPEPASQGTETQLEFYEMLPKYEVPIPNDEGGSAPDVAPSRVEKPGAYVVQAGSFRTFAEADRRRALIAMHGVESRIQKVKIDNDTWHRVRIGPIRNLQKLEETRSKLRELRIDEQVIPVDQ